MIQKGSTLIIAGFAWFRLGSNPFRLLSPGGFCLGNLITPYPSSHGLTGGSKLRKIFRQAQDDNSKAHL